MSQRRIQERVDKPLDLNSLSRQNTLNALDIAFKTKTPSNIDTANCAYCIDSGGM